MDSVTRRAIALAVLLAVAAAATGGCSSQIAGLAPVGGDDLATARIATIDAVLAQKLTIRDAPVCTDAGDFISCVGTLTDGAVIQATTQGPDGSDLSVVVNGTVIYDGPIQRIIDEAAQDTR